MAFANKCIFIGNLTRDPQLKFLPSQTALVEFGIAINRKFKGAGGEMKEDVLFLDCKAFGKSAETINQYVVKGNSIYLECRLQQENWEDKNGGGKRSKIVAIVEGFQFLGNRKDGESQPRADKVENPIGNAAEFDPSDIPF